MSAQQIYDEVIIDKFNGRTPGFPACQQGMGPGYWGSNFYFEVK